MTLALLAAVAVIAFASMSIWPAVIMAGASLASSYMANQQAKKNAQQANTAGMFGGPRVRPMPQEMAKAPPIPSAPQGQIGSGAPSAPPIAMASQTTAPAQTQGSPAVAMFAELLARARRGGT